MTYTLEQLATLAGLALVPAVIAMIWMMMLQRDLRSGRRVRLRLRDLSTIRKLYLVGLVGYFVFVLFFDLTTVIPLMTETGAPFLTVLQDAVEAIWLGTLGFLGVGLLHTLRSPARKTTP